MPSKLLQILSEICQVWITWMKWEKSYSGNIRGMAKIPFILCSLKSLTCIGGQKRYSVLILTYRNSKGNKLELVSKFKQCVQYYLNGTNDGFLKYRPRLGQCKNDIYFFNDSKKKLFLIALCYSMNSFNLKYERQKTVYVFIDIILYAVLLVGATPRQGNYAMPQRTIVS